MSTGAATQVGNLVAPLQDAAGAVLAGKDSDPIVTLLKAAMGESGFRAVILVVLVSFVSCLLSLQAAASRLVFAYARDQMIFGSRFLSRMSPGHHVPANALIAMGAGIAVAFAGLQYDPGVIAPLIGAPAAGALYLLLSRFAPGRLGTEVGGTSLGAEALD